MITCMEKTLNEQKRFPYAISVRQVHELFPVVIAYYLLLLSLLLACEVVDLIYVKPETYSIFLYTEA